MREGWIIVPGASRGIGAAIASDPVRRGARVTALSRSGASPAGQGVVCGVHDEAALAATFEMLSKDGPIAGLVNNAGQHRGGRSAAFSKAEFDALMRLNAGSVFAASRLTYPYLVANCGGTIVNIGSFFDKPSVPDNLAYCASKAAVGAITRWLAVEWARDNICVRDVAPGCIETDLNCEWLKSEGAHAFIKRRIPVRRAAQSEEVARLVGCLIGEEIDFLSGEAIYIDGAGINH